MKPAIELDELESRAAAITLLFRLANIGIVQLALEPTA
jgi:hypothetical protein